MTERSTEASLYTKSNGQPTTKWILITLVLVLFALFCLTTVFYLASHPLDSQSESESREFADPVVPDFSSFDRVEDRKSAFFGFLTPLVEQENQRILDTRHRLIEIKSDLDKKGETSKKARDYIARAVKEYRFEDEALNLEEQVDELLHRVDKVPLSMALAQAATESAWGRSRFARNENNYFGQWCFKKGCGAVPSRRGKGKTHEVASFDTARHSVRSYLRNINTHRAYRQVRKIRAGLREADRAITGLELIKGLGSYSERGQDYIDELRHIIAGNQLAQLDNPQPNSAQASNQGT